jgi:glutathione S-transferase
MLKLVIGNKAYSSWSLRPWIYLRQLGVPFEEIHVSLYQGAYRADIARYSPAGKVPVLIDSGTTVWDSLAILEYLAERHPQAGWPRDARARAMARAVSAEMHSGFGALRENLCMNVRKTFPWRPEGSTGAWPAPVLADVERIQVMWEQCRELADHSDANANGKDGPFLFGPFSPADAMYAPVAWRFAGYCVPLRPLARAYVDTLLALPGMQEWRAAALAESEVLPQFER